MFSEVLTISRFWVAFLIGLLVVAVFYLRTVSGENKRQKKLGANGRKVLSASFQQPITISITVAGMMLPLCAALITYAIVELDVSRRSISVLLVSIIFLSFGVAVGIFNTFSIASASDDSGNITITDSRFTCLPAQVVSQCWLILVGVVYLSVYCFLDFQVNEGLESKPNSNYYTSILRPELRIGQVENEMRYLWGEPSAQRLVLDGIEYSYFATNSRIRIIVKFGLIHVIIKESME